MTDPTVSYGCTHKTNISSVSVFKISFTTIGAAETFLQDVIENIYRQDTQTEIFISGLRKKRQKVGIFVSFIFCLIITTDS